MKKRFLMAMSVLLIFGLVAVAFAYNRANAPADNAANSCPLTKQTASTGEKHEGSCCGMADCCKDGICSMGGACCKDKDSCPMQQKAESKETGGEMDMSKVAIVGADSSDDCCKKGADCCKGGTAACCKKHKS